MTASGKFPGLEALLVACEADRREREHEEDVDLSSTARLTRRRTPRDIVEVDCNIAEVEPDDTSGVEHMLLQVELTGVIESDAAVDADVRSHLASHAHVLVAIQYADRRRIAGPIPGLVAGAEIRVRGAWIPAKRAHPTGGEKLAVLHFTHAPVGFVIVGGTTYC